MNKHTESESDGFDEIFCRKLKLLSLSEIENIIADALNKAVDADYQVEIKNIDFEPLQGASFSDTTEIKIIVKKKIEHFLRGRKDSKTLED